MPHKWRIDAGGRTYLPLCSCSWRGLPAVSRDEARRQAAHHEARAHPGEHHARQALSEARRRQNGSL